MNAYARSAATYLAQRVLGASPEQQAALIMEAGQMHLGKAIQALIQDDVSSAACSFLRVTEVLQEATLRLDLENGGELAQNLENLYGWWSKEIMLASQIKDLDRLKAVGNAMGGIREAWTQLHEKKVSSSTLSSFQLGDQVG